MSDRDRTRDDEELARAAEELAGTLRDLRDDLDRERDGRRPRGRRGRRDRRGPLGLPRPPSPREVLEFADEVAIPTVIAILEANIKLLEGLRRVIRLADAGREAERRGRDARDRAADAGRATLDRLSDSLADLQSAVERGDVPEAGEDLLTDIQALRSEVDDRLATDGDRRDGRRETDDADGRRDRQSVDIDVDAELDSLRDRYRGDDEEDDDGDS
jgi:hypothetical protein